MKAITLLLLTISCLQPRESLCKRDSSLCEDKKNDGDGAPLDDSDSNNDLYNPWDWQDPETPTDPTITDPETPTEPTTTDPENPTDPTTNPDNPVITVDQLSPDTKLTDITIEGRCTQAGCIHAEKGKNFKLWCNINNLPCYAPFKLEIKTKGKSMKGMSATKLCSRGNRKVSEIIGIGGPGGGMSELSCHFDNDAWVNAFPKTKIINLDTNIVASKYICVYNSRQGNDLYINIKAGQSGLCDQSKTALQLEFKW